MKLINTLRIVVAFLLTLHITSIGLAQTLTGNVIELTHPTFGHNSDYTAIYRADEIADRTKVRIRMGDEYTSDLEIGYINHVDGLWKSTFTLDGWGNSSLAGNMAVNGTNLYVGRQQASAGTAGESIRLSLRPYGHTGGLWTFKARDTPSHAFMDIHYGPNQAMTVNSDGFVGIGTLSPEVRLAVQGDIRWGNNSMLKIDQGSAIEMRGTGSPYIDLSNDGESDYDARFILYADDVVSLEGSSLGIGTSNPGTYKLAVEGKLGAREVIITTSPWADYVFEPDYELRPLSDVEKFIKEHKHLPEIPTTEDINRNGANVGEINALLLKKVEELTLYMIGLKKENEALKERMTKMEEQF